MTLFRNIDSTGWRIFAGNVLMLLTGLCYTAWWIFTFLPGRTYSAQLSTAVISCAFLLGGASLVLLSFTFTRTTPKLFSVFFIFASAVLLYIILLFVTRNVMGRPVTSELAIMLIWASFEIAALDVLLGNHQIGIPAAIVSASLILIASVAGFICYVKYYELSGMSQFISGLIPLAADSAVILIMMILQIL